MINNFDYIFFVLGFIFILLALVLWNKNNKKEIFSWKKLSIFALGFGLSKWINVFFIAFGDSVFERIIYYFLYSLAFLFLFEFTRKAWKKLFFPFLGLWIYPLILALSSLIYYFNFLDLLLIFKFFIVFPAVLFGGIIILIKYFSKKEKKSIFDFFLGLSFLAYFFNIYFLIFKVKFLFNFINEWNFFDKTCIFVDSFSVIFLIIALLGFWFTEYRIHNNKNKKISNVHHWIVLFSIIITLFFGHFATNLRAKLVDDDLRYKLSFQVNKIAEQINPDLVEELSFTEKDKDSIYFQRIEKYLKDYSKVIGVKSLYTMSLLGENIVFGPESLSEGDILASSPGTIYENPAKEDWAIFEDKKPYVVGPVLDEYGSFVKAGAPVISSRDSSVIMVVAIDIAESDWSSYIIKKKIVVIGFVLVLLAIILAGSFLLNIRKKKIDSNAKFFYYLEGFFVGVILIYFTFFIAFFINIRERKNNFHSFYELSNLHIYTPYQELKNIRKYQIASLGRFFENSEEVSLAEFHQYAAPLIDFSLVNFFEWIPEIYKENINYFEELALKNNLEDFSIFSFDENGKKIKTSDKNISYPIFYVEPFDSNKDLIGFDVSSDDIRRASILKAKNSGLVSISDPISLIGRSSTKGARISWPILKNSQEFNGFITAVIYYDNIFNKYINNSLAKDLLSEVNFYQYFNSNREALLSSWPEKETKIISDKSLNHFMDDKFSFIVTYPLFIFGETYFISAIPSAEFFIQYSNNLSIVFSIFGIIFSIFVGSWIGFLGSKNIILKEQINLKTKSLRKKSLELDKKNKEMVQEKNKIEAIIQGIGDGVFVIDKNLKITLYNKKVSELSGYSIKEALGQPYHKVLKFIFEDSGKINDKFIKKAFITGKVQEMSNHTFLLRKDGEKIPVADSAAPLKNKKGEVIACVVVFRDTSKERQVNVMKNEFISLTSHQLKTPLSTINWYLELLLDEDGGSLTASQKDFLAEISKSNKKMIDIVNSLLNISRLEKGTFIFEAISLDLIELSKEVLDEYKEKIKANKIKVKTIFSSDPLKIVSDRKIIKIILQNLISNAIKYSPSGKKVIVDIFEDKNSNKIKINVSDQGYGIPKNQQAQIFEKLFRADNVREKNIEGTGLGLYLLKIIVEKIGGTIKFDSQEGIGTTFQVVLPLKNITKN